MLNKFRIDILSIVIAVVLPGLAVWFEGDTVFGLHSAEARAAWIVALCIVFVVLFLWCSFDSSARPAVAMRRVRHWVGRQFKSEAGRRDSATSEGAARAASLLNSLRDRHGWRWRYRQQWVLVVGDDAFVKRLAPGLVESGYAITGDAVLLYARPTSNGLDTGWLDHVRGMRGRRPVDAIVAVEHNGRSSGSPCDVDDPSHWLMRYARALRWAAPVYLLNVTDFGGESAGPDEAIGFTWTSARVDARAIDVSLQNLSSNLADVGTARLANDARDRYPAALSQHISRVSGALAGWVLQITRSPSWKHTVHGVLFVPLFNEREPVRSASGHANDNAQPNGAQHRTIWQTVAAHSRKVNGRRIGFSLSTTAAWMATVLIGCWLVGTMLSGFGNRATISSTTDTVAKLTGALSPAQSLQTLTDLDRQIDTLEIRQRTGAPLIARFGLNRDEALLDALWPHYADAANRILIGPIRRKLEARLHQLASLSDAEIASGGEAQVQAAYDTLKTYLMLARPEQAVAAFLAPQLAATSAPERPAGSQLSRGKWEDMRQHAITFLANHIGHGAGADRTAPAIVPDGALIASTRQTIVGVRGIQNSGDAIYQQIVDEATPKYPPLSLATLLGDAASQSSTGGATSRGLFGTTATVPGVFTRAAWEERISKAIDEAGEQRDVASDWVLSDTKVANASPSTLKAELRQRYFDDYARAWALFLNSLRWQPAPTLSATADQLTLLGDPQRSPLVALMNAVVYQAGTGANAQSLSDTLISKAQQLVGADEKDPSKQAKPPLAPLAAAFGPILRLTGSDLVSVASSGGKGVSPPAATGDLSLARYLERITAMRLKTAQIVSSPDPDAIARLAAQSVLQGKTSDIADSRDYASRVAASLGEQWSGFGALFRAPFDQSWQVIVQPAAASLNEIWRTAILADWNRTFGGRYPFADSDNDASLPEMARFMRPDSGVVAQFVTSQLAGVVERHGDRWVASQGADSGALTIDPAFLNGLNKLARTATVLFPSGDARVRYELRAEPTPGVTDMRFVLSGRELHYFNQKQEWTPFEWPGQSLENLSHIEWQTEQGGLRTALDSQGRFGFIRLLERAKVAQQDNARYLLTWTPDTSQGVPLRVQLRSEAGAGPLDVLQLRHFALPARVFVTAAANAAARGSASGPPPLPTSAIEAEKHAAVPLPSGLPGSGPLPDEARWAASEKVSGRNADREPARASARTTTAVPTTRTTPPKPSISPVVTTSALSDPPASPFRHALTLLGDAFVF